ncbi:MAG: class I SAM-dependent methyltransferase [Cyclobacteriaceae bacterium]|nr:class I SAM-dependent methyltransferase [Cyclobacteriaceae bacterium]
MKNLTQELKNHYHITELYEDIVNRLKEMDLDLKNITRKEIASVDEFHVRGAAVSKELADSTITPGAHVLDIGSGLGGPGRLLADEFNCTVTGIDLSDEYVRTANLLSKLVSLEEKTKFVQGDATNLPFENSSFDVVWTQHVQMNIPDKQQFYSEINRVLKSGGHLIYYDIFKNEEGEINYPMPWANSSDLSFLFTTMEMNLILNHLGMKEEHCTNQSKAGILFFEGMLAKIQENGPPKLGLNVLMGASTKTKLVNLLEALLEETILLQSGVFTKYTL